MPDDQAKEEISKSEDTHGLRIQQMSVLLLIAVSGKGKQNQYVFFTPGRDTDAPIRAIIYRKARTVKVRALLQIVFSERQEPALCYKEIILVPSSILTTYIFRSRPMAIL